MRKLWFGLATLVIGAALLVPAAAGAFNNGDRNKSFAGSSPAQINVTCLPGASSGTATFTVTISKGSGSGNTGELDGGSIVVTRPSGVHVHTFTDYGTSPQIVQTNFPCPARSSTPGSVTFTFQPKTSTGANTGTATSSTSATNRTLSSS